MKIKEQPYTLLDIGEDEWRVQESAEMMAATQEFDMLLGWPSNSRRLESALRRFLQRHPNHVDALHHYSTCRSSSGKPLDAFAFSQTAVATALGAFPKTFVVGTDRLPTGFVQNRPFLRALHGLMLAQRAIGLIEDAIATGNLCLELDPQDRMGARLWLPIYLLQCGRDRTALELMEQEAYDGTFDAVEYLHALALIRLGRHEESRPVLRHCLQYYPQVARFILDPTLPAPPNSSLPGCVCCGSEFEGWMHSQEFSSLWRALPESMKILRDEYRP